MYKIPFMFKWDNKLKMSCSFISGEVVPCIQSLTNGCKNSAELYTLNVVLDRYMAPFSEAECDLGLTLMFDDVFKPVAECSIQYGITLYTEIRFV